MTKRTRHSEIRVTGADGVTHIGTGDGMAQAVRQLGEQHAASAAYRLTVSGAYLAAALASDDYLQDDTNERAERMLARFELAERLADDEEAPS
jgi:hypothetical protein